MHVLQNSHAFYNTKMRCMNKASPREESCSVPVPFAGTELQQMATRMGLEGLVNPLAQVSVINSQAVASVR